MIGVTVNYRLEPRRNRPILPKEKPKLSPRHSRHDDRTARMLALAHHVEALVEQGRLPDYATAARVLGLTRARMTQVMNLLLLAPEIQGRLLLGNLSTPEHRLRTGLNSANWEGQSVGDASQRRPVAAQTREPARSGWAAT